MKIKNLIKIIAKLCFAVVIFYLIFNKIDYREVIEVASNFKVKYLLISFIFLTLAQLASSFRTRYYIQSKGKEISRNDAVKLYFLSTFFNIFLPGGIGGDAYKIFIMAKNISLRKIQALQVALSERINGFYVMMHIILLILLISNVNLPDFDIKPFIPICFVLINIAYFVLSKIFLSENFKVSLGAAKISVLVQVITLLSFMSLEASLRKKYNFSFYDFMNYAMIFMVANIVVIVPLSFGGAGMRELTFLYLCPLMGLETEIGITLSLAFFINNIFVSLLGGLVLLSREKNSIVRLGYSHSNT